MCTIYVADRIVLWKIQNLENEITEIIEKL
jgi:hypothetical protein